MDKNIYFDNAATTFPKPEIVYRTMDEFYRNCGVNAGRGSYELARQANMIIENTREILSEMVDWKHRNKVILTPSATIALNQIIFGLDWKYGSVVYVTPFEHNAILRPLNYIKQVYKIRIEMIPFKENTFELDEEKLTTLYSRFKPNFIFMSHVSNVTGYILPIDKIISLSNKYNPICILDCAQSIGLIPISVTMLKVDFLVFAGHKTLYGPFGIAGYIDNSNIRLKTYILGGTGSNSLDLDMPDGYPDRYEAASKNIQATSGLNAAIKWLKNTGINVIREEELKLTKKLVDGLKDIYGIRVYCPNDIINMTGIISFNHIDYNPNELGQLLDQEFSISVRTGYHCAPLIHDLFSTRSNGGTVRVSLSYFNKEEEIDYLLNCLNDL